MVRLRIEVRGRVQGVGFRPAVYRSARGLGLRGWVANTAEGVLIEAQGPRADLERFVYELRERPPRASEVRGMSSREIPLCEESGFDIVASIGAAGTRPELSPDIGVCGACLGELRDPRDRRRGYPFLNCTDCGPRFTIIEGVPYDRGRTTMKSFRMCPLCRAEFDDPGDRRFHAQPTACPACGPRLVLTDGSGKAAVPAGSPETLPRAALLLRQGRILAVKGLGGFHLACDALDDDSVAALRARKHREDKPFAIMAAGMEGVRRHCRADLEEEAALTSPQRPIVLLERLEGSEVGDSAAPGQSRLGFMLPYTPLHAALFDAGAPEVLVMTSGNLSEEPIAFENGEALERLGGVADAFLLHDRDIRTRCDDSVCRVFRGKSRLLRRSRGFSPDSIPVPGPAGPEVLAVGGELKNAFCLLRGERAHISQHIGDLKNLETLDSFEDAVAHLLGLLRADPAVVACDAHPDYLSSRFARAFAAERGLRLVEVQHHHAHAAACLAENCFEGKAVVLAYDGAGSGPDGTVWGGEVLVADRAGYRRAARLTPVPLPGGDAAVREVWRMGAVWLRRAFGGRLPDADLGFLRGLDPERRRMLERMIDRGVNSPLTSSMGRLFDAAAALMGLRREISYEGQAAIELEMLARGPQEPYPFEVLERGGLFEMDPSPCLRALVSDLLAGADPAVVSGRFHAGVAAVSVRVCEAVRERTGLSTAALTGGVFQNGFLLESAVKALEDRGFSVLMHREVPANDGGLCLGQAAAARLMQGTPKTCA